MVRGKDLPESNSDDDDDNNVPDTTQYEHWELIQYQQEERAETRRQRTSQTDRLSTQANVKKKGAE